MGWFIRVDRFGDTHVCFSQTESDSCGLASTKMIVFKVNKLSPGKDSLTTENKVAEIYKKYDDTAVNVGTEGVFFKRMHHVLNELDIGTWAHSAPGVTEIPGVLLDKLGADTVGLGAVTGGLGVAINSLMRGHPIMLKVQWSKGSHAVVVDTINKIPFMDKYWLSICDPGDGDVHITGMELGKQITYEGASVSGSINFWGKPEIGYSGKITGHITDLIYRVN